MDISEKFSDLGIATSGCQSRTEHKASWTVDVRNANRSAFNGYRLTPSDYSQVRCPACPAVWRTKAAYVATLPDTSGGRS